MLTPNQEKYLLTIPENKRVKIFPYNPKVEIIAEEIIKKIHEIYPQLEVAHIGAAALEIAGQNDLDINILSKPKDYDKYLPGLTKLFGKPAIKGTSIKWSFDKEGFEIEVYLTDKESPELQEQLRIFNLLKNNPKLLAKYEELKKSCDGISFREYQKRKYEFYNRILDQA